MNDEIKEILDMFTKYKDDWYSCEYKLKPKQCVTLYDYITNLQQAIKDIKDTADDMLFELKQENERLKVKTKEQSLLLIDYQDMEQRYEDYKSRCEKASEIIKKEKEIMGYAKYDSCLLLIENTLQNGGDSL